MAFHKYFTLSFDDGQEQDKQIVKILKEAGLSCCTFNINGGMMGEPCVIGRIGNLGILEKKDRSLLQKQRIFKYVPHDRIPEDEVKQVYEGFEIASHGFKHENFKKLSLEQAKVSICSDLKKLSEIAGQEIVGFAYPYGAVSDATVKLLKENGVRYARTVSSSKKFDISTNLLRFNPTCWMISKKLFDFAEAFIKAEPVNSDLLFYVWGHGYELDFGTKGSNWDRLKKLCGMMAEQDDIICCTNREVLCR
ncbi:MAG: polysaccharide deacetylase family protein [Clostridiales bacterium]|nr:polysaccharide deacetylase family protein [Clostridiales bacterium]